MSGALYFGGVMTCSLLNDCTMKQLTKVNQGITKAINFLLRKLNLCSQTKDLSPDLNHKVAISPLSYL